MNEKNNRKKQGSIHSAVHPNGVVSSMIHPHPSHNDPLGSYTGLPEDYDSVPVQDADDL